MKISKSVVVLAGVSNVLAAPVVVTVTEHAHNVPVVTVDAMVYESEGVTYTSYSTVQPVKTVTPTSTEVTKPIALAITDVVVSASSTENGNVFDYLKSKINDVLAPATATVKSSDSYTVAEFPSFPSTTTSPTAIPEEVITTSAIQQPTTTSVSASPTQIVTSISSASKTEDTTISDNPGLSSFASSILAEHNAKRSLHKNTGSLNWSDELATYAQNYADNYDCSGSLTHSGGPYGENLALGYSGSSGAVNAWYDEISDYDFTNPGFSSNSGHFTQLVWKGTSEVGCGIKSCNNEWHDYIICSYNSPGNVGGEYADNVNPLA